MSKIGIEIIEGLKGQCLENFQKSLDAVKNGKITDANAIERLMDGLLSFGDDERFVKIYKELRLAICSQYSYIVYTYDQMFDDMWNDNMETIKFKVNSDLYWKAREILEKQGIDINIATVIFMKMTVQKGDLPFPYTKEDIEEAKKLSGGKNG